MIETLTRDVFAEQLNSEFLIYFLNEQAIASELVEVSELKKRGRQEVFSVFFNVPLQSVFPQQLYKIEHPQIGTFELFLVPISGNEKGILYESVFNRLLPEA